MRILLALMCIILAGFPLSPANGPKAEVISGQTVAYSAVPICLNGNAYWSILIRVQGSEEMPIDLIRVDFSMPCDKSPDWIPARNGTQKFRLFRKADCDENLTGSVEGDPSESKQLSNLPIWKRVSASQRDTLPFGQILPCYRSANLPLVPVV